MDVENGPEAVPRLSRRSVLIMVPFDNSGNMSFEVVRCLVLWQCVVFLVVYWIGGGYNCFRMSK